MITIGILLTVSVAAAIIFARVARRRVFGKREELSDAQMLQLFHPVALPSETILGVLKQIGLCYGVSYAQLRPTDCFLSQLSKIDSWRSDLGAEMLEKWLREKYGVAPPQGVRTFTIWDLIRLIESRLRHPDS